MAAVTYYVALPVAAGEDGPVALEAVECMSANAAIIRAESLSRKEGHVGAIAFSRTGDPGVGEFDDAVLLRKFGDVGDLLRSIRFNVSNGDNSTAQQTSHPLARHDRRFVRRPYA